MRLSALLISMAIAGGCAQGERWSKQDWAKSLAQAEARLPSPPAATQSPSCSAEPAIGKCFLDPDERSVRYAVLVEALRVQSEWTARVCEQVASRTKRASWPALADKCAHARSHYVMALRGGGPLDDAALVEASDRDGRADYVRFLAGLVPQLGTPQESAWHQELRVAASRRSGVPELIFPLPPAGCNAAEANTRDCALEPGERLRHRLEILTNFLDGWIANLWAACDAQAVAASPKELPALASACLDFRDFVITQATKGIGLKDNGLIECRGLSLEERDWPRLIADRIAGKDDPKLAPGKLSPCVAETIDGHL